MDTSYSPPYELTSAIVTLVAEASQLLGRLSVLDSTASNLRLRRANRIRTIQGSLAIEGNTLSEEQVTAIVEGKRILAPPRELQEVRNAILAYERFDTWTPDSLEDLLAAHRVLMAGLVDDPGSFRSGGVGVMAGERVIHVAPPAGRVPALMKDLFAWIESTDAHPLIASSIFHYEFEFIHPFADGNGRIGRLWQSLILSRWNPLFANLPVESIVYQHQAEYYDALNASGAQGESSIFIEFMLRRILDALKSLSAPDFGPEVVPEVTPEVMRLLKVLKGEMTRKAIQAKLGLKDEKNFRRSYQQPAVARKLIEMTIPDKPNSRLQKYRITSAGRAYLQEKK